MAAMAQLTRFQDGTITPFAADSTERRLRSRYERMEKLSERRFLAPLFGATGFGDGG